MKNISKFILGKKKEKLAGCIGDRRIIFKSIIIVFLLSVFFIVNISGMQRKDNIDPQQMDKSLKSMAYDTVAQPKTVFYGALGAVGGFMGSGLAVKYVIDTISNTRIEAKLIPCNGWFCDALNIPINYVAEPVIKGNLILASTSHIGYWGAAIGAVLTPSITYGVIEYGSTIAKSGIFSCTNVLGSCFKKSGSEKPQIQDYFKAGLTLLTVAGTVSYTVSNIL